MFDGLRKKDLEIEVDYLSDEDVISTAQKLGSQTFDRVERTFDTFYYEYKPLSILLEDINGFLTTNGISAEHVTVMEFTDKNVDLSGHKNYSIEKIREELKKFIVEAKKNIERKEALEKASKKLKEEKEFKLYQKLREKFEKPTGIPVRDSEEASHSLFHYLATFGLTVVSVGMGENELHVYLKDKGRERVPSEWRDFKVVVHEDFDIRCNEVG